MHDDSGGDTPDKQPIGRYFVLLSGIITLVLGIGFGMFLYDVLGLILALIIQIFFGLMGVTA